MLRCQCSRVKGFGYEGRTIWKLPYAKLPNNLCLRLARITTKDIWDIDEVLQVLSAEEKPERSAKALEYMIQDEKDQLDACGSWLG